MVLSKDKQQFKIGRMTYSLPSSLRHESKNYYLSFTYNVTLWGAYYTCFMDDSRILECEEKTFNKALKELHSHVKGIMHADADADSE